jgi:hypothetical protein
MRTAGISMKKRMHQFPAAKQCDSNKQKNCTQFFQNTPHLVLLGNTYNIQILQLLFNCRFTKN